MSYEVFLDIMGVAALFFVFICLQVIIFFCMYEFFRKKFLLPVPDVRNVTGLKKVKKSLLVAFVLLLCIYMIGTIGMAHFSTTTEVTHNVLIRPHTNIIQSSTDPEYSGSLLNKNSDSEPIASWAVNEEGVTNLVVYTDGYCKKYKIGQMESEEDSCTTTIRHTSFLFLYSEDVTTETIINTKNHE